MIPANNYNNNSNSNNSNKYCPYSTPSTVLDTSKVTGAISPTNTSSVRQLSSHSTLPSSNITTRIYPDETPPTQAQIDIVRYSWERISEIRLPTDDPNVSATHAFGLAFYDALFELDPSLKTKFSNIVQQARALAGMISYIARAPNITENCGRGCGFSDTSSSKATNNEPLSSTSPPLGRALTIREINARKRKENSASTFSELVTNAAAANRSNTPSSDSSPLSDNNIEADPQELLHKLREMGARHYFYQVQPHHFALVGPAVLAAIKVRLGRDFLPEVAEAWTRVNSIF